MDAASQCRWQFRLSSEKRWEWLPESTCAAINAAASQGKRAISAFDASLGEIDVDLRRDKLVVNGSMFADIRGVPTWWGEDANLASGILVACQDAEHGTQVLLGVENRPWWPEKQAGPFWGFVEPTDPDLPSAMAREAFEETLGVLGSEDEVRVCLQSDTHSVAVCQSPWHQGPDGGLEILRLVSLGQLLQRERTAIRQSFQHRRSRALAAAVAATALSATGAPSSPASHLEVEELQWTSAMSLCGSLQDGEIPSIGKGRRPLRGFVAELLQEGLRWPGGQRFRDFCNGNSEVLQPMPHFRALLPRLIAESGRIAFAFTPGRSPRELRVTHLCSSRRAK